VAVFRGLIYLLIDQQPVLVSHVGKTENTRVGATRAGRDRRSK
jgi:hypothetical protein